MLIKVISLNKEARNLSSIDFSFFDAVDNKLKCSKYKFNTNLFNLIYGRCATNGEKGCALSHYELIADFYNNCDTEISLVVLEDDAILEPNFKDVVSDIILRNSNEPETFLLGLSKTTKKNNWVHKLKWPQKNKIKIGDIWYGYTDNNKCGTVGYIVNKKAAEIICQQSEVFWLADDWNIFKNMGINVYYPDMPVVYEDLKSPSSTGNDIYCHNSILSNPYGNIIAIFRGLKRRFFNKQ